MKKKRTILQKFNDLIRKARIPRWLHHFGPKKFTAWQHMKCLLLKEKLKCSYRRLLALLPYFNIKKIPHRSTLIKFSKRIPVWMWNLLLKSSIKEENCTYGAIDATGISRIHASNYYLRRIDRKPDKRYIKLSLYVDVKRRKILSARIRAKPRHDVNDVCYLIRQSPYLAKKNLMDKGYDSNNLHRFFRDKGVTAIIPVRESSQRLREYPKGVYRREMYMDFPKKEYNLRNIAETVISVIKRKYGDYVNTQSIAAQRTQIYSRLILHNISLAIARHFHLSLLQGLR